MVSGSKLKVAGALSLLGGALALGQGCSTLVGIEKTNVEEPGGASGGAGKGGSAGDSSGGKGASGGSGGMQSSGGSAGSSTSGSAGKGGSSGGGAGKGGSGGSSGGSSGTGGDAGASDGGTTSGSAGMSQGGMPATGGSAGSGTGGTGGLPADCASTDSRCTSAGVHQICTDGVYVDDPCELDKPTCEDGACIVRGPTLIQVSDFYIDATEVTVGQYKEFLAAKDGDTGGQIGLCGWNTDFDPSDNPGPDDWPVAYVDWCDAKAYCTWADKHLCGRLDGEQITLEELLLENDSQWFRACGGPNGSPHPNGDPVCNTNGGFDPTAPVATFPGCEGYYPGIFDMEGNVAEWVDLCEGTSGASDTCYALGGSTYDDKSYCTRIPEDAPRDAQYYEVGFRCCSG